MIFERWRKRHRHAQGAQAFHWSIEVIKRTIGNDGGDLRRDPIPFTSLIDNNRPPGPAHRRDERLVDVHVGRLRQKIEDDPTAPRYVVTVRVLGYKFQR